MAVTESSDGDRLETLEVLVRAEEVKRLHP